MKVKVPVATLIEKIEESKADVLKKYDKELADYPKAVDSWRADVHKQLLVIAGGLEKGKDPKLGRYGESIPVPAKPTKPTKPNTYKHDRDLGLLKAAQEEVLAISTDSNLAAYL